MCLLLRLIQAEVTEEWRKLQNTSKEQENLYSSSDSVRVINQDVMIQVAGL